LVDHLGSEVDWTVARAAPSETVIIPMSVKAHQTNVGSMPSCHIIALRDAKNAAIGEPMRQPASTRRAVRRTGLVGIRIVRSQPRGATATVTTSSPSQTVTVDAWPSTIWFAIAVVMASPVTVEGGSMATMRTMGAIASGAAVARPSAEGRGASVGDRARHHVAATTTALARETATSEVTEKAP
jgi:hypothetical protein